MMNRELFETGFDPSRKTAAREILDKVGVGTGLLGIAASISIIASSLPYVYGKDDKAACGAQVLISHFNISLAVYVSYVIVCWYMSKIIEITNDGTIWRCVRWALVLLIAAIFSLAIFWDYSFISKLPSLPEPLTPAACQAVVNQARFRI